MYDAIDAAETMGYDTVCNFFSRNPKARYGLEPLAADAVEYMQAGATMFKKKSVSPAQSIDVRRQGRKGHAVNAVAVGL